MNAPPKIKTNRKSRILWLLLTLFVLVVTAATQREWLARIPNAYARSAMMQRRDEKALEWLELSRRVSDECAETDFLLGRLDRRQGRMEDANRHLRRARFLGYSEESLRREEILAMAQSGQMNSAQDELADLLNDPRGDEREICEAYLIGYLRLHQFAAAMPLLEAWLRDYPDDPQAIYWSGLLHRELYFQGQTDEKRCIDDFNRVLALKPNHHRAAYALAEILLERSKPQDAARLFQLARESPDLYEEASVGYVKCLINNSEKEKASQILAEVLERNPRCEGALQEIARLEVEQANYQSAYEHLKLALSLQSGEKDLRYLMGVTLRGLGKNDEAKEHLEFATKASAELTRAADLTLRISQSPNDANTRYEIGSIYLKYGSTKRGLIWLENALQCDPNHLPTHRFLAEYYEKQAVSNPEFRDLAERHRAYLARMPQSPPAAKVTKE